ncbi:serine protease [Celeribacter neptunius]|uniref:Putative peptidoglycan binding domain-containing protein n=1 Tax=Celeribacter neptunius TaxID=588602 RepID=A0A1I3J2W4_9RHOB|nr:serine protease [Celeribacter neptunius]SFI54493.1 Putative peptidoglycan binding domain-containing protein [Celeribacter neptunius]
MKRYLAVAPIGVAATLLLTTALHAEQWIQIEAQPTLTQATEAAQGYAASLPNVVGFALPGRWHAIALGPYATEVEAESARQALRADRQIPGDSYITDGARFQSPFWPVGANLAVLSAATTAPDTPPAALSEEAADQVTEAAMTPGETLEQPPVVLDETPAEARASERQLDRSEREALQIALRFAGTYNSGIDGAFGPGTRRAMSEWQTLKGYEPTGVLTSRQRGEVLAAYRNAIDSLGMRPVVDEVAGIAIELPMGLVKFDSYAPPFAKYSATDGSDAQVLLISQTGDEATLGGLYEIMQTLEIVPMDGPRSRDKNSFTLTGSNARITSHTEARLVNGTVKGWTLIWPAGKGPSDEKRHQMALDAMKASFAPTDGILPDAYGDGAEQDIDLMAGLDIRRPEKAGSGFYVDDTGTVLTSADLVAQCARITLTDGNEATVSATEDGLALLTPSEPLAPLAVAAFDSHLPRLQSEVSVAGFAYADRLDAPTLNYGLMAEHKGLSGEEDLLRLAMNTLPGEAGGPLMNTAGAVIGMLLPTSAIPEAQGRSLPEDVAFAYDMEKLVGFLSANGVTATASDMASTGDADLVTIGRDLTVLVNCWN